MQDEHGAGRRDRKDRDEAGGERAHQIADEEYRGHQYADQRRAQWHVVPPSYRRRHDDRAKTAPNPEANREDDEIDINGKHHSPRDGARRSREDDPTRQRYEQADRKTAPPRQRGIDDHEDAVHGVDGQSTDRTLCKESLIVIECEEKVGGPHGYRQGHNEGADQRTCALGDHRRGADQGCASLRQLSLLAPGVMPDRLYSNGKKPESGQRRGINRPRGRSNGPCSIQSILIGTG